MMQSAMCVPDNALHRLFVLHLFSNKVKEYRCQVLLFAERDNLVKEVSILFTTMLLSSFSHSIGCLLVNKFRTKKELQC